MRKPIVLALILITLLTLGATATMAGGDCQGSNNVPGHCGRGGTVNGHYTQTANGCDYVVNYRGDFGGDPYLDNGWIINNINCGGEHWTYLIVHESDPRYTGNPEWAVWGTWEYHVLAGTGYGNFVRPEHAN